MCEAISIVCTILLEEAKMTEVTSGQVAITLIKSLFKNSLPLGGSQIYMVVVIMPNNNRVKTLPDGVVKLMKSPWQSF